TIYLYDNQPGGIGLAERIFEVLPEFLTKGLETLEACACPGGCSSCVGPVNEVGRRAKPVALALLKRLRPRRGTPRLPPPRPSAPPHQRPPRRSAPGNSRSRGQEPGQPGVSPEGLPGGSAGRRGG